MTRDKAIMMYDDVFHVGLDHSAKVIDFYIKTGILKVEEEKTVEKKLTEILKHESISVGGLLMCLNEVGLKIVEKD